MVRGRVRERGRAMTYLEIFEKYGKFIYDTRWEMPYTDNKEERQDYFLKVRHIISTYVENHLIEKEDASKLFKTLVCYDECLLKIFLVATREEKEADDLNIYFTFPEEFMECLTTDEFLTLMTTDDFFK